MESTALLPSKTLYINNLNDKLKPDALKKQLYFLFSQYGRVVQIVASKGSKVRGQAWVDFQDTASATNALRAKQGFNLFGKPLNIQFAKPKSEASEQKSASGRPEKRKREESSFAALPLTPGDLPNRILFAQNLPSDISEKSLNVLFAQCPGFEEVRLVPGGRGMAFIEFDDEIQSTMALKQLHGFQITASHALQLAYSSQK